MKNAALEAIMRLSKAIISNQVVLSRSYEYGINLTCLS
jgi:hypothetical protein